MSETIIKQGVLTPASYGGVNPNGWKASLTLNFEAAGQKTFVRRQSFGPYNIQRPFYPEGSVGHVYLLHPPGGLVGGDSLLLDVTVSDQAHGLLTTPGAGRFYRSQKHNVNVQQTLLVKGGALEWLPQETIYFNGCQANTNTDIHLNDNARFLGWEIQCLGRPASQEPLLAGSVCNVLTVYKEDVMVLRDRLQIDAPMDVGRVTGLRGADVHGLLLATGANSTMLELLRNLLKGTPASVTKVEDLLLVRYLGSGAESAKTLFVELWKHLRPVVMNRPASIPRIWST